MMKRLCNKLLDEIAKELMRFELAVMKLRQRITNRAGAIKIPDEALDEIWRGER